MSGTPTPPASWSPNAHLKPIQYSMMEFGVPAAPIKSAPVKTAAAASHVTGPAAGKGPKPSTSGAAAPPAAAADASSSDKLELPNAVMGQVVTRFPPEASGYIHIGHAKAALVNSMLRTRYNGKMIFRFDDTNPAKEKEEFEHAIIEDLAKLGVTWEVGPTFTSDYFDLLLVKADELIQAGLAYCDDTPKDELRRLRGEGIATACRERSIAENARLWKEMLAATEVGQKNCLRAKISLDADNKALRDPVLYRVNLTPHARTKSKYKAYPTYDFACPIVDSVEGVTHALRTNEYHDRNAQYFWICDALKLRKPNIEDFSRLNMEYSLMSKRKLTQLVADGVVEGWDDPRFPTVRGLLRRGLKVEALKDFVRVQGMSKAVNFMEWSKLWNFNTQLLDPSVPRYTAVNGTQGVRCAVEGAGHLVAQTRPRHRKNAALGDKTFYQSDVIFLDAADVALLQDGEEVTLMDWGNAFISNLVKDPKTGRITDAKIKLNVAGDVRSTKYKLTWVAENVNAVVAEAREYDYLLTKKKPDPEEDIDGIIAKHTLFTQELYGEAAMSELKQGDFLQLERRGYYIVDQLPSATNGNRLILIFIPDGRDKVSHLSAKTQFYNAHPELAPIVSTAPTAAAASTKKAAAGGAAAPGTAAPPAETAQSTDAGLTLEEKRALKAAKKTANSGAKPPAAPAS